MQEQPVGQRLVRLAAAVPVSATSFVLVLHADVGLGPWHVLQQGIGIQAGVSIGVAGWIMGVGIAVVAALLGERCGLASLAVVFAGGAGVDLLDPVLATPDGVAARAAFLLVGTIGMALGGALLMSGRVGVSPLDALMTGLYRRSPIRAPIAGVRLAMEAVGLLVGLAAGGSAGVGSVVIGIGIGPAVNGWLLVLGAVPERIGESPVPGEAGPPHPPVSLLGADLAAAEELVDDLLPDVVAGPRRRWRARDARTR